MRLLLTLTLLVLTLLPAGAVKKFEADPINLAILLVEKTDSTQIANILTHYGYTPQNIEDGYQVMRTPTGNEIRYSFTQSTSPNPYPTVIVKATGASKSLDTKLKEQNFQKKGNTYERIRNHYSKFKTQCSFGPKSTMILRRIPNAVGAFGSV